MIKRIAFLLLSFIVLITNTGCWNNRDLSELSISTAFGIDETEDGKTMVSVQIVNPSAAKNSGNDSGGGSGNTGNSFVVVSYTDDTVFGALRKMLAKVNKKIFYSSAQVIVIGENAARSGIKNYLDFILRDHETQFKNIVVIAKGGTAKEVLEQKYDLSKVNGAFLSDTVKNVESRGFGKKIMLIEVARELATEGRELSIGTVVMGEKITATEGIAVFLNDKMVGWLDEYEARGYMFSKGRISSTIIEVEDPKGSNNHIAVEVFKVLSDEKIEFNNGKPAAKINIEIYCVIGEQEAEADNENEYKKAIEKSCNEKVKNEINLAINKCQKVYKSDIFGYGAKIFDKYPKYWRSVKENWNDDIFSNMEVKVEVNTAISRTGLLSKPIEIK